MNFWERVREIIENIIEFVAQYGPVIYIIGAVLGLGAVEYLYFTNAEKVRLLYVLLLAPVGVAVGLLVAHFAAVVIISSVVATIIAIPIGIIWGIIYLLHSIIVWRN